MIGDWVGSGSTGYFMGWIGLGQTVEFFLFNKNEVSEVMKLCYIICTRVVQ